VKKFKIKEDEDIIEETIYSEDFREQLLDDDEIIASLSSIQHDEDGKIFGSYSHITEGIIRAAWLAEKEKGLNIFVRTF